MSDIRNTLLNAFLESAVGMALSSGVSFLMERRSNGSKRQLEEEAETTTNELKMQEELDVTLYSLQQELMKIRCAISAARRRRITDQELLEWLAQIINAAYLGNCYHRTFKHYNSLPLMIESQGTDLAIIPSNGASKRLRTSKILLSENAENMKLHVILQMLKSIDIQTFYLMVNAQPERPMKTYLYKEHNILLIRDKERQEIMDFLFEPNKAGENNVDILPIVGPRGGGKTIMALDCLYDPKVLNHFSLKCYLDLSFLISKYFSDTIKEILDRCNNTYPINSDDLNTLLVILKQNLSSEKFLFVVDGYIRKVDCVLWNALLDCLRCGKQGSKVIFITSIDDYERNKMIVNPEAVMPAKVNGFSENEYILYFMEHAFGDADPEDYPTLAKIGVEIAEKMNGSIWGAKILGEVLRDNLNVSFWSNFLQADFLSYVGRFNDAYVVRRTLHLLLPKKLRISEFSIEHHRRPEVITFRELMALGPNQLTSFMKGKEKPAIRFLVGEYVFLNEYRAISAVACL